VLTQDGIILGAGTETVEEHAGSPLRADEVQRWLDVGDVAAPRTVVVAQVARLCPVQDEGPGPIRVGRREQDRDSAACGHAQHDGLLGAHGVEHDTGVLHPVLDARTWGAVRQPGTAFVEHDETAKRHQTPRHPT
jgi:hypothetical protein